MANILICGDSWGCGEWNVTCTEVNHTGLEQYLVDSGHTVYNISKGGCSNLDSVNRIKSWLERNSKVDSIFVFQTEYTRDAKHHADWQIISLEDLAGQWIENFYARLSEIAQEHNCNIYIIGGASDTAYFENMSQDYPGCHIVCQSLTNLIINDNSSVSDPVFSWYGKATHPLLELVKKKLNSPEELLKAINLGFERESELRENPQWFFPDGIHPNRQAHRKLYNFLKEISIV
jgi:hypothetical protein